MKKYFGALLILLNIFFSMKVWAQNEIKLDLKKSIQLGLYRNYDLKYNRIEQLMKKKIISEKWRAFLPLFSIEFGNSYDIIPYENDTRMNTLKFKITQPIYQGGRYYADYKVAQIDYKVGVKLHSLLVNNIKAAIQKQFFSLIVQKEILSIQKRLVEHAEIQKNFAIEENKLGMLTSIDLAEIEAKYNTTLLDEIKAKNKLTEEYNQMKKILYIDWRDKIKVDETIISNFSYKKINVSLNTLIQYAYNHRKDLLKEYAELLKANYNYKLNKYYYLPAISLNCEYTLSGEKFYPFNREWNVGIKFDFMYSGITASENGNYSKDISKDGNAISSSSTISPFSDLSYIRKYIQAEVNLKSLKVRFQQMYQDVAMDVEEKYSIVNEKWKLLNILIKREEVLQKRDTIYKVKLQLGEAKRVDALKAEIEYYQAQVEKMQGILGYINSIVNLELAIGADIGYLNLIHSR